MFRLTLKSCLLLRLGFWAATLSSVQEWAGFSSNDVDLELSGAVGRFASIKAISIVVVAYVFRFYGFVSLGYPKTSTGVLHLNPDGESGGFLWTMLIQSFRGNQEFVWQKLNNRSALCCFVSLSFFLHCFLVGPASNLFLILILVHLGMSLFSWLSISVFWQLG